MLPLLEHQTEEMVQKVEEPFQVKMKMEQREALELSLLSIKK
jgi:hypothetical protein